MKTKGNDMEVKLTFCRCIGCDTIIVFADGVWRENGVCQRCNMSDPILLGEIKRNYWLRTS